VAYVIGEPGPEREMVAEALREATGISVVPGDRSKGTLNALGSRNVRLIAVSAASLGSVGFRNEFALRRHQPKLSAVPVFVFGEPPMTTAAAERMPGLVPIGVGGSLADLRAGLRRHIRAIDRDGSLVSLVDGPARCA
jgi:hypothetical protein